MDVYVIKIAKLGLRSVNGKLEPSSQKRHDALPYLDHMLCARERTIYGISIAVDDDHKTSEDIAASWRALVPDENNFLPLFDTTIEVNQDNAADILIQLSDALPLPGSYTLRIAYDFRGRDIIDSPISVAMAGAIRKLCCWHYGQLEVFTECELSDYLMSLVEFMDPSLQIRPCSSLGEPNFIVSKREIGQRRFSLLRENMEVQILDGFTLFTSNDAVREPIVVDTGGDFVIGDSCIGGNVWIGREMNIVTDVDITTVPFVYYTGRKFELQYKVDDRYPERNDTVQSICHFLSSESTAAYVCRLHYAISDNQFTPVSKLSATHWHQSVMDNQQMCDVPKCVPDDVSSLHFLLTLSQVDNISNHVVNFTCHILNRKESINWNIPYEHILQPGSLQGDVPTEPVDEDQLSLSSCAFQSVNVLPLLSRYNLFKSHASKVLREWLGGRVVATISSDEFASLIDKSLRYISAEITKSWKRCIEILEPLPVDFGNDTSMNADVYELQKNILKRIEEVDKCRSEGLASLNANKSKDIFDMHLTPDDILKHFLATGEPKNGFSILNHGSEQTDLPSTSILANFHESMKLSYHGILYNVDELESEKYDRTCRRLVEKCVKFETRSVGSISRVPSHSIIPVGDSPMKNETSSSSHSKKTHLEKVAEKLHQKRINKRKSVPQNLTNESKSSSMVLRSTPKKARPNNFEAKKVAPDEQKRRQRKSYVQDNKKRLEKMVASALIDNGVPLTSKRFECCSRRLYNVCMAFLRDLKSSKNLDKIMKDTVSNNVQSVVTFEM